MPKGVKLASLFLLIYGATILFQAIWYAMVTEWSYLSGFVRAVVRCLGFAFIAWTLLKGQRWAWWVSVIASGLFFLLGLAGYTILVTVQGLEGLPLGSLSLVFGVILLASLGLSFGLLLFRESRQAFR
jgi:hypothetical protein